MILSFNHKNDSYQANLLAPIEIGIAVQRANSVASFGIAGARYMTYIDGDFIGDKSRGGPCNLETITFTPHGNSTHTECLGHISSHPHAVNECIADTYHKAILWSLAPSSSSNDFSLDFHSCNFDELKHFDALIIRTLPNTENKKNKDYSGLKTPYISTHAMQQIVDAGVKHIVIDLPSVDPEWDGGALAAHHIFWQYPHSSREEASITEFAYIPSEAMDGEYILKLNISNFVSDAAPSKPVLYSIKKSISK